MDYTVRDALSLEVLSSGIVVAGENGLSRKIKKVSVLEIPFNTEETTLEEDLPPESYELVISALYAVAHNEKAQLKIIENLDTCDCSGLILCYVDTWMKTISRSFIELANRLNFPVIVVPSPVTYSEIIACVMDRVLNIQSRKLEYALKIHEEMTHVILRGKDSSQLIQILESMIHNQVLYLTPQNDWIYGKEKGLSQDLLNQLTQTVNHYLMDYFNTKDEICIRSPFDESELLISPISISSIYYGTLVIFHPESLSELDRIAISQAKNTFATISLNQVRMHKLISSNQKEYLYDILHGNFDKESRAISKGTALGIPIETIRTVMIADLRESDSFDTVSYTSDALNHFKVVSKYIKSELSTLSSDFLYHKQEDKIIILVPDKGNEARTISYTQKLGSQLINSVKKYLNRSIFIGIGNYYTNVLQIQNSYQEALQVIKTAYRIPGSNQSACYKDFQLFCQLQNTFHQNADSLLEASAGLLDPLLQYDQKNDTQLYTTFEMLMENQLSTTLVSEKMFIHKNTLLQRRKKILKILERDPFEAPYYSQYQFALLITRMLKKTKET